MSEMEPIDDDGKLENKKSGGQVCPYDNCGKSFTSKWSLTRHLRTHTGEKPFRCDVPGCGKEFIEKCALKRHETTHSNGKQYMCNYEQCGRKFKLLEHLQLHRKTHDLDSVASSILDHDKISTMGGSLGNSFAKPSSTDNGMMIGNSDFFNVNNCGFPQHRASEQGDPILVEQLRSRLVRMSVKHHEEVSFYIRESEWLKHSLLECSNALHEAIGLLRQYSSNNNGRNNSRNSSCDSGSINNNCANGAINTSNSHPSFSNSSSCKSLQSTSAPPKYVLESKLEDELEAHSTMTSGGEDMFPKNLIAAVAKYNVENIANYCKSSVRVPSADEQLSFLSKVRNDESAKPSVLDSSGLLDQPVHPGILQMQNPMHGMNYFTHSSMPPMNSNCVYNPYLGGVPCNMNNPHLMYGTAHSHGMTSSMGLYGTENMSSQIPLSHSPLTTSNGGASDAPTGTMRLIESLMHKAWSAPDSPNSHPKNSGCSETGWKRNSYIHEEEGKCSFNDEYQRKKIKTELGSGNNRVNINQQNPSNACKHVPGEHLILNTSMAAVSTTDIPMCPIHKSVPNEFSRLLHRDADGHFTLMPPKSVLNSASELKS